MERLKLAVLISGRGSNLQSIIDACASKDFPAEIAVVVSNMADAYGLVRAKDAGLKTEIIDHKIFASREAFEDGLQAILIRHDAGLVCLAGFMRLLTEKFVNAWQGRMINIHPSLLPKFKGLHTHERALEAQEKISGCTVHYVTPGMDEGPVILQKTVTIAPDETHASLAEKVLAQEHIAYPEAIRTIAPGLRRDA